MPYFYFHVHEEDGSTHDEEGRELPDLDRARTEAIKGVRSILSAEVAKGHLDLRATIDVTDSDGKVLLTIPFRDVIEIHPERRPTQEEIGE